MNEDIIKSIQNILDHDNQETREKLKELFKNEVFIPRYSISLKEERELAYKRLKIICENNVISTHDFGNNPCRIFSVHEIVGQMDGSTATKMTVQFNLFGGTIFGLGNKKHHETYLDSIDKLDTVGCFAFTELGYGNNAVEMKTTATYKHENNSFIINTPETLARKYWITNGAIHATHAVVFARLIIKEEDEGVHAFLVKIRDVNMESTHGISIWDMGHKIGSNGVDNASISFNNISISKISLLGDISKIDENGVFSSKIKSKRGRLLFLADRLLSGRLCIASMMLGAAKYTLETAIIYGKTRKAVGEDGKSTSPILDYQLQQRALMPLLVKTYAYNFALNYAKDLYQNNKEDKQIEKLILCCSIKAVLSWHNERTASICRERCGGQGFLSVNRFGEAIMGSHAGITAEGDNKVLMQKVSKELLTMYKNNKAKILFTNIISKFPVLLRLTYGFTFKNINNPGVQCKLLNFRKELLISKLALRMRDAKKPNNSIFNIWMKEESDTVQQLAHSYIDHVTLVETIKNENKCDSSVKIYFNKVRNLYALSNIEENLSWYMTQGLLTKHQSRKLTKLSQLLCSDLVKYSGDLCDAFGIPKHMKTAPIANDWIKYNDFDNKGELLESARIW